MVPQAKKKLNGVVGLQHSPQDVKKDEKKDQPKGKELKDGDKSKKDSFQRTQCLVEDYRLPWLILVLSELTTGYRRRGTATAAW
jgi:hypothetical protein